MFIFQEDWELKNKIEVNYIMKTFEEIKVIYDGIFKNLNGYGVSLSEKQSKIHDKYIKDLIYGEIPLELLYALFQLDFSAKYLNDAKVFYDLGSGIGNAVIGAFLIGNFEKCIGVELLDSLFELSKIAEARLNSLDINSKNKVKFLHDNILNVDISNADVILFCCPNKDENIRNKMEEKFKTLKSGTVIFSLIHVFKNKNDFKMLSAKIVRSAWGETPLMIYIKK